ncbi:Hint domain-containing protein [Cystobacter fuscus]|nr:Hint domain-containing protein [Cystobacter fuscus]
MRASMFVAVLAFVGISSPAMAQLATRCTLDDQLTNATLAQGRNAWARKCGFISAAKEAYLNSEGEYQVFLEGCYAYPSVIPGSSCSRFIPADVNAACIGLTEISKLGTCVTGCLTPTQKVSFGGKHMPIPEALASGAPTVTALTPSATMLAPTYSEQPIRAYIAGDTIEDVFALHLTNGITLEVTSEHPMVDGEGNLVKAKSLKAGDLLLASDGQKVSISDINVFRFKGYVWNVQPSSHDKAENIFDVEGLLTGSVRFQNEWADIHYRLATREEADVQGL